MVQKSNHQEFFSVYKIPIGISYIMCKEWLVFLKGLQYLSFFITIFIQKINLCLQLLSETPLTTFSSWMFLILKFLCSFHLPHNSPFLLSLCIFLDSHNFPSCILSTYLLSKRVFMCVDISPGIFFELISLYCFTWLGSNQFPIHSVFLSLKCSLCPLLTSFHPIVTEPRACHLQQSPCQFSFIWYLLSHTHKMIFFILCDLFCISFQ